MPNAVFLKEQILKGAFDEKFLRLYGETERARARYARLADGFLSFFGEERELSLVSAPGRTEIIGNHTDYNNGIVMAAAVQMDIIAAVSPNGGRVCRLISREMGEVSVDLSLLDPIPEEKNTTAGLVRGVARGFADLGASAGGFDAYTMSDVLKGAGVSSSAAFEITVAETFSALFNNRSVSKVSLAVISQFAENHFFGKPSGLMDQLSSAVGGFVMIDFADSRSPVISPADFDFNRTGYKLCIVDTGSGHADLTDEYSSICDEMKKISLELGQEKLRNANRDAFEAQIPALRRKYGDRPVIRAMHFFTECQRVTEAFQALKENDFSRFLELVSESGRSSFCFLQNAYSIRTPQEQGVSLALALTEEFLGQKGACRLHGGGFGGTIQAYVPEEMVPAYKQRVEAVFGEGKCHVMRIRPEGSGVIG